MTLQAAFRHWRATLELREAASRARAHSAKTNQAGPDILSHIPSTPAGTETSGVKNVISSSKALILWQ